VLVALGYLAGIYWLSSQRERMGFKENEFWGLIYAMFFGAVAGGKLLYWAVEWRALFSGELHPFRDFRYGFVFMGGFMGSAFAAWIYGRRTPFDYLKVGDHFGVAMPLGHTIGRLACLFSGCCAGRPTALPWGVRFTRPDCLVDPRLLGVPLHPTPVYESAANALIAFLMLRWLSRVREGRAPEGSVLLGYLGLYGIARFFIEFFRGDDRGGFLLGMSLAQWTSLGWMLTASVVLATLVRRRRASSASRRPRGPWGPPGDRASR
jgi:phosphatidylglycerol:prolipoprotein diacylglycerol transferase